MGKPCDAGLVLASVRHVFAHGYLTANARGIEPSDAATICSELTDSILRLIDAAWREKVEDGPADWAAEQL